MAQTWHDLLFAHWPLPPSVVAPLLPAGLPLDTFDGQAWLGVVPFHMTGIRLRLIPPLPGLSAFPELNVRTYATLAGKPGVYFLSLDAANRVAVATARRWFHLPYVHASMGSRWEGEAVRYVSERTRSPAAFRARFGPSGPVFRARPGSLDHWLTERYCLYVANRHGTLYRGDVHHLPWPVQPAWAEIAVNTMAEAAGLRLPETAPRLHFSRRLEVRVWGLEQV